jgi:hypothetical protein
MKHYITIERERERERERDTRIIRHQSWRIDPPPTPPIPSLLFPHPKSSQQFF